MIGPLDPSHSFMKGTESKSPHCIALKGIVGTRVECLIYQNRPSPCRNFIRSWEHNRGNFLCDKARSYYNLQPFSKY
jgi:Fe-S-cluster containining protein